MSPLDSILGLEGLFIEQVQRAHDIHVWAGPRKRACCVYCANPRVRIKEQISTVLRKILEAGHKTTGRRQLS